MAASVVLARTANGWTEWKNKDDKTLDEVVRQNNSKESKLNFGSQLVKKYNATFDKV